MKTKKKAIEPPKVVEPEKLAPVKRKAGRPKKVIDPNAVVEPKRKPGRPRKIVELPVVKNRDGKILPDWLNVTEIQKPKPPKYTEQDCRTAIATVMEVKGEGRAFAYLKQFKIEMVPDLKAEDYDSFVIGCNRILSKKVYVDPEARYKKPENRKVYNW